VVIILMSNLKMNKGDVLFHITSVSRSDLIASGISRQKALRLTGSEMSWIASKMADAY
jgi:hypothetical protein